MKNISFYQRASNLVDITRSASKHTHFPYISVIFPRIGLRNYSKSDAPNDYILNETYYDTKNTSFLMKF